jgi:hypothetical protein
MQIARVCSGREVCTAPFRAAVSLPKAIYRPCRLLATGSQIGGGHNGMRNGCVRSSNLIRSPSERGVQGAAQFDRICGRKEEFKSVMPYSRQLKGVPMDDDPARPGQAAESGQQPAAAEEPEMSVKDRIAGFARAYGPALASWAQVGLMLWAMLRHGSAG